MIWHYHKETESSISLKVQDMIFPNTDQEIQSVICNHLIKNTRPKVVRLVRIAEFLCISELAPKIQFMESALQKQMKKKLLHIGDYRPAFVNPFYIPLLHVTLTHL